jgi:nickel-dependent lactate racemase
MNVDITSGDQDFSIEIPDTAEIEILAPVGHEMIDDLAYAVDAALQQLMPEICRDVQGNAVAPNRITLVIGDNVKPEYLECLLPKLWNRMVDLWSDLQWERVTLMVRSRPRQTPEGLKLQSILRQHVIAGGRVVSHDPVLSRVTDCGITPMGTPVLINSELAEADLKIVVGQISPSQLIGLTGGANSIAAGCAGAETLEAMSHLLLHENTRLGCLESHPLRRDMADLFELAQIQLALSFVLDPEEKPVRFLVGSPGYALKEAARICSENYGVQVSSRFDIVVAACDEKAPNYCRKTVLMASQVVCEGGRVLILTGQRRREVGSDIVFNYVCQSMCPEALISAFRASGRSRNNGEVDDLMLALIDKEIDLTVGFDQVVVERCQFRAADPSAIVREWIDDFEGRPRVAVVPDGNAMCCFAG